MRRALLSLAFACCLPLTLRADITTSLLEHYACQDNAASTVVVASPGTNGALVGAGNTSASSVAGPGGLYPLALQLDGSDDRITITDRSAVGGSDWTMAAWLKLDVATPVVGAQTGFMTVGSVAPAMANAYPFTDGVHYISLLRFTNGTTGNRVSFTPPAVTRTNWHHVAITTTPGANGWKFYVNGVVAHQATGQTLFWDSDLWAVGRSGDGTNTFHLDGAVAGVRLYNRALSGSDVLELYLQSVPLLYHMRLIRQ